MAALHLGGTIHKGRQKSPIRHHVDNAGDAAGAAIELKNSRIRENYLHAARRLHPVPKIGIRLLLRQGQKMKPGGNALGHLPHMGFPELFLKLRLPYQNHLQNFFVVGFNVGEQPDLLHHVIRNQLGLVYQKHRPLALSVQALEKIADKVSERSFAGILRDADAKLLADLFQHFQKRESRVVNHRRGNILRQGIQKSSQYNRFAGAYLSREKHKAAGIRNAVPQHGQGFLVMTAEIKVFRIRRDAEGKLA